MLASTFEEEPVYNEALRQLEWAARYLLKIHFKKGQRFDALVIQIGDKAFDHTVTTVRPFNGEALTGPEAREKYGVKRPVYVLDNRTGGSDLLAEACSAFAALSMVFDGAAGPGFSDLSVELQEHAVDAFDQLSGWNKHRLYTEINPNFGVVYTSKDYRAHMFMAAAWMYKMLGDKIYKERASEWHAQIADETKYGPVVGWDNPTHEGRLMMEELGVQQDIGETQRWIETAMFGADGFPYTRGGMVMSTDWGNLRISTTQAAIAFRAADILDRRADESGEVVNIGWAHYARCFGVQQMRYVFEGGTEGHSFVTGWGKNPPKRPHHRGAKCAYMQTGEPCFKPQWDSMEPFPNELPGAMVGGPRDTSDTWTDDHRVFQTAEVANDWNAALISGVSGMMRLPEYFWKTEKYCPKNPARPNGFPMTSVDFGQAKWKPIPTVKLTTSHPSVVSV